MINKQQKKKILKLVDEGLSQNKIAELLKVSQATVGYWASEELRKKKIKTQIERFRNKSKEERSKIYKKRLEYQKKYQNYRYKHDEEFRRKQLEAVKKK